MLNTSVAVINASTVLRDDDVAAAVPALQKQVSEHLSAVWGVDATLNFVQRGASPPAGTWWLTILDNSDQAGSVGYHDLTNEGLPLGKVFAGSDMVNGYNWTVTASHELLEMLIDPDINRAVFIQDETGAGKLYAYEICDPCESDQYGYQMTEFWSLTLCFPHGLNRSGRREAHSSTSCSKLHNRSNSSQAATSTPTTLVPAEVAGSR